MNEKISDIFDYGDEIAVDAEPDGYIDPARIKELTMKRINNEYNIREKTRAVVKKTRFIRRTALIAAVMAVLLAGTAAALAVYRFTISDTTIGEPYTMTMYTHTNEDGSFVFDEVERIDRSTNGLAGTPEYQAYVEWTEWNDAWWEAHPNPWAELGEDDTYFETPENYAYYYNASFPEQAEKLDEIIEKYGLTLHTANAAYNTEEELCSIIGLEDIVSDAWRVMGGYMYDDGSFRADCELDGDFNKDGVIVCAVKGSFSLIGGSLPTDYEEWGYTAADGTEVVFAAAGNAAFLAADTEGAFITATFRGVTDRSELEAYADGIRFAALSERFSENTSDIAEAVAALFAQAQAAQQEELENFYAPFANREERDAAVFEELGHYTVAALPAGYDFLYNSADWMPNGLILGWDDTESDSTLISGGSTWGGANEGDPESLNTLMLSYRRYYDRNDTETVTNSKEFEAAKAFYRDRSLRFTETAVNGYDAVLIYMSDTVYFLTWYDTERELVFTMEGSGIDPERETVYSPFTEEELINMAESVTEG